MAVKYFLRKLQTVYSVARMASFLPAEGTCEKCEEKDRFKKEDEETKDKGNRGWKKHEGNE